MPAIVHHAQAQLGTWHQHLQLAPQGTGQRCANGGQRPVFMAWRIAAFELDVKGYMAPMRRV
ncbi:hypothetical protein [Acidovorax sp. Root267]|uniref:hypothetical protein n=1 Tax=Acidovorax sp. Root267 TaxID=1736505 RepID=UPI001124DECC|nr:hypothetical protein [Acidovorax sp. Root267]